MFQAEGLVEAVFRRQVVWSAFGVELPLLLVIINSHNSPWESQTPSTVGQVFYFFPGSLVCLRLGRTGTSFGACRLIATKLKGE